MITVNRVNTKELLNSEADGEDVPAIAAALRKGRVDMHPAILKDTMIRALWVPAMEENT